MRLFKITLLIGILLIAADASACSCVGDNHLKLKQAVKQGFQLSEEVIIGKVISISEEETKTESFPFYYKTITLAVKNKFKDSFTEITIQTPSDNAACGYLFEEGHEYLIYAYTREGQLRTDMCTRTKALKQTLKRELRIIKRLKRKQEKLEN